MKTRSFLRDILTFNIASPTIRFGLGFDLSIEHKFLDLYLGPLLITFNWDPI